MSATNITFDNSAGGQTHYNGGNGHQALQTNEVWSDGTALTMQMTYNGHHYESVVNFTYADGSAETYRIVQNGQVQVTGSHGDLGADHYVYFY